jgi:hypothetical protein
VTNLATDLAAKVALTGDQTVAGAKTFSSDLATSGKLLSNASAGDEGGEIFLNKAVTNTTITGGVTVDVYQDKLRIFEQGGTARGFYLDMTAGAAGVASPLASAGQGGIPFKMAAGAVTMTYSGTSSNVAVTFPSSRFSTTPIINVSQSSLPGGSGILVPKFTSASSTGFTLYAYTGNGSSLGSMSVNFNWTAMQMTSGSGAG